MIVGTVELTELGIVIRVRATVYQGQAGAEDQIMTQLNPDPTATMGDP